MAFFTLPHSSFRSSSAVVSDDLSLSFPILSFAWPSWPVKPSSEFLNSVIVFAIQNLLSSLFVIVSFLILILFITFMTLFSCLSVFSCRLLNLTQLFWLIWQVIQRSPFFWFGFWTLILFLWLGHLSWFVHMPSDGLLNFFLKYQIYFNI